MAQSPAEPWVSRWRLPPGDGMARVLAVACTTAISLLEEPEESVRGIAYQEVL